MKASTALCILFAAGVASSAFAAPVGLSRAGRKYLDANANSDCSAHGWHPGCRVRTKTYDDGYYSRSQGNSDARGGGSRASSSGDARASGYNPNTYTRTNAHAGPGHASASSSSHSGHGRRLAGTNADANSNCHAPHCRVGAHTRTGDYHSASYSGAKGSDYHGSSGSADAGARAHGPNANTRTESNVVVSHGSVHSSGKSCSGRGCNYGHHRRA